MITPQKLSIVSLHAVWLVGLTILFQYIPFTRSDELDFLKWAAILRHNILLSDQKPLSDSVVFIDVSYDLDLIPSDKYTGAKQVVSNRSQLASLLSIINKHPDEYKYVLCDILLSDSTSTDDSLKIQLSMTRRIITSAYIDEENKVIVQPVFDIPSGIVNYNALDQSVFYKLPIMYQDSLKSLPVKLFEAVSNTRYRHKWGITTVDGWWSFNYILPEYYYRERDLQYSGAHPNAFYLGELLLLKDDCFEVLKNKYIIIANYAEDNHNTYLGKMPGALILWDCFLTLKYSSTRISIGWMIMLYVIYWVASLIIFCYPGRTTEVIDRLPKELLKKVLLKYISAFTLCIIIDYLSMFLFGTFISIFYMATYLTVCALAIEKKNEWWPPLIAFLRRRSLLILLLIVGTIQANAQSATVTHLSGQVYCNGKLLKVADKVKSTDTLTAKQAKAELGLLDLKTGRLLIKFEHGKPVKDKVVPAHPELLALTVDEYIENYTTTKLLTHKGGFDIIDFLADSTGAQGPIKVMFLAEQQIPLISTKMKFEQTDKIYLCIPSRFDTICTLLLRSNDEIIIPTLAYSHKLTLIKAGYIFHDQYKERYFPYPLELSIVDKSELKNMIKVFKGNLTTYYHGDTILLRKDVSDEIFYWYGRYYEPDIDKLIDEVLE